MFWLIDASGLGGQQKGEEKVPAYTSSAPTTPKYLPDSLSPLKRREKPPTRNRRPGLDFSVTILVLLLSPFMCTASPEFSPSSSATLSLSHHLSLCSLPSVLRFHQSLLFPSILSFETSWSEQVPAKRSPLSFSPITSSPQCSRPAHFEVRRVRLRRAGKAGRRATMSDGQVHETRSCLDTTTHIREASAAEMVIITFIIITTESPTQHLHVPEIVANETRK